MDRENGLDPLTREALRWVLRLTTGFATEADLRACKAWRAQSPTHEAAFMEAAAFRRMARAMPLVPPQTHGAAPHARHFDRRAVLAGAGLMAAGAAGWTIYQPPLALWPSLAVLAADHHTGPGERQRLTPSPGVSVELNGRSALSVTGHGHGMSLVEGEAYVAVSDTHDRDFTIEAGGRRFSTRSASLDVRTSARETCAVCLSGELAYQAGDRAILLGAGQQLTFRLGHRPRVVQADAQSAAAWRQGRLVFRNTPLETALEAVNRYRSGKIILTQRSLAERPVNGVFHTDQIDNSVEQFQQLLHVPVTHLPGGVVLIG